MKVNVKSSYGNSTVLNDVKNGDPFIFENEYHRSQASISSSSVFIKIYAGYVRLSDGESWSGFKNLEQMVYLVDAEVIVNGRVK